MSKYYTYVDMDGLQILSEEQILKEYWPYWSGKKIAKYGYEYPFNARMCIEAWCVTHRASETDENGRPINNPA
jgi:hypothetical protein